MEKKNLIVIKLIGILGIAMGIMSLWFGFFAALIHSAFLPATLALIYALGVIVSAVFILKLKNLARIIFIVLLIYTLITQLWIEYSIYSSNRAHGFSYGIHPITLFIIMVPVLCICYLTRPKVKEQFK